MIRCSFNTPTKYIENEIKAIIKLREIGAHPNVVNILDHGKLRASGDHFIDMELCNLDLQRYLQGNRSITADHSVAQSPTNLVFVANDCGLQLKLQNTFTVLSHITNGLKFAHEHDLVHRDVKPANSKAIFASE